MRKVLVIFLVLVTFLGVCADFKIIREEDGRYYLTEEDVKLIAGYILKLEDLINNYRMQISKLEELVANYKGQIAILEQKIEALQAENTDLKKKLERSNLINYIVVASVVVGGIIFLFVR